jgi:hypothetical protein
VSSTRDRLAVKEARDKFIRDVSQLMAGLQVPVSMEVPLGTAAPAWTELHRTLIGFGWAQSADYEAAIVKILEEK